MDTWIIKLICVIVILIITVVFGFIPFFILNRLQGQMEWRTSCPRANFILGCLNSFGGGVFLGTAFFHLLPEVQEAFNKVFNQTALHPNFPVTEGVALVGLFVVMLLEHLVLTLQHHHNDVSLSLETSTSGNTTDSETTPVLGGAARGHSHSHSDRQIMKQPSYGTTTVVGPKQVEDTNIKLVSPMRKKPDRRGGPPFNLFETGECVHVIEPDHHQHHHLDSRQLQGIRSFVLLLALSLHTVFEGLALGLQSRANQIWTLLLALSVHKIIIAFTLGLQFAEHLPNRRRAVIFIIIFSLMAPIGIGIGTSVTEATSQETLTQGIASATLQGLATGTFIYVTFFEVLQKEVGQDHSLIKVFLVIIGCACMAGLVFLEGEDE